MPYMHTYFWVPFYYKYHDIYGWIQRILRSLVGYCNIVVDFFRREHTYILYTVYYDVCIYIFYTAIFTYKGFWTGLLTHFYDIIMINIYAEVKPNCMGGGQICPGFFIVQNKNTFDRSYHTFLNFYFFICYLFL